MIQHLDPLKTHQGDTTRRTLSFLSGLLCFSFCSSNYLTQFTWLDSLHIDWAKMARHLAMEPQILQPVYRAECSIAVELENYSYYCSCCYQQAFAPLQLQGRSTPPDLMGQLLLWHSEQRSLHMLFLRPSPTRSQLQLAMDFHCHYQLVSMPQRSCSHL